MRYYLPFIALFIITSCGSEKDKQKASSTLAETNQVVEEAKVMKAIATVDSLEKVIENSQDDSLKKGSAGILAKSYNQIAKQAKTEENEAKYIYKEAIVQQDKLMNYDEAFGLYDALVKKYPDTKYGMEAEFHMAMLMHQYYGDINKAVNMFQAFAKKHPEHSRTPMAKDMVKQAHKTAEQLMEEIKAGKTEPAKAP